MAFGVFERHRGTDDGLVAALGRLDDLRVGQDLVDLCDALLDKRLLVLGVVVLGVLGNVAELAGDADALAELIALLGLEVMQLLFELCLALGGKNKLVTVVCHACFSIRLQNTRRMRRSAPHTPLLLI